MPLACKPRKQAYTPGLPLPNWHSFWSSDLTQQGPGGIIMGAAVGAREQPGGGTPEVPQEQLQLIDNSEGFIQGTLTFRGVGFLHLRRGSAVL